jgi:hypothetical protein
VKYGKYVENPPTEEEVVRWFTKWCKAGIACLTPPEYVVIDVDPRHWGDETAYYLGLTNIETPTILTPRGGTHLILKNTGNHPLSSDLGPGVEVKGPGWISQFVGKGYEWEAGYEFGEVEVAEWPKSLPRMGNGGGGFGAACGGFWSDAVEECLSANGYDINEVIDPEQRDKVMAEIESQGVGEGYRFFSMKGVLRWHWVMGADYWELEELGLAFAERCTPSFAKEGKWLLEWVRKVLENDAKQEPPQEETPEEEPIEEEPINNVDAPKGLAGLLTEILLERGAPESGCGGKLEDQVVSWIREKPEYTTWLRRSAHLFGRQLGLSLDGWLSPEYQYKMDKRVEDRGKGVQRQIATRDRPLRRYRRSLLRACLKEATKVKQAYQQKAEEAIQKGEARAEKVKGEKAKAKQRAYAREVADRILDRGNLRAIRVRLEGEKHALKKFRRLRGCLRRVEGLS